MGQRFCGQIDFPGGKGWWKGGWTRGRDLLGFTEWTKLKNCSLMCDLSVIKSIFQYYFLSLFFFFNMKYAEIYIPRRKRIKNTFIEHYLQKCTFYVNIIKFMLLVKFFFYICILHITIR